MALDLTTPLNNHQENNTPRNLHAAVLEPVSQRLWLIGGRHKTGIQKMSVNVVPLKVLALEQAARNMSEDDLEGHCPKALRKEIEAQRLLDTSAATTSAAKAALNITRGL